MLRKYQPSMLGLAGLIAALAALAVGGLGASSASALPELLWCEETPGTGTFETESECLENKNSGVKLNWTDTDESGAGFELMIESGLGLMTAAAGLIHIECETDKGSFTKVALVGGLQVFSSGDVTFEKCIELKSGSSCNSIESGFTAGVILTKPLVASLVYLKKTAPKTPVGILLEPETPPTFVEIECGGTSLGAVTNSIIGEIVEPYLVPVGSMTAAFKIVAGKQQWIKVEEEAAKFELLAFGETAAQLESEEKMTLLINNATLSVVLNDE